MNNDDSYKKVKPVGLRLFNSVWYLAAFEDKVLKTFIVKNISNMKIGNKQNLFSQYDKKTKFSWEEQKNNISLEILLPTYLYEISKHLISGYKTLYKNYEEVKLIISTNDFLNLYKFLILLNGNYKLENINNGKLFMDYINEI